MQIATTRHTLEIECTRSSLYLAIGAWAFWAQRADHPRQSNEPFAWSETLSDGTRRGRIGPLEWCASAKA